MTNILQQLHLNHFNPPFTASPDGSTGSHSMLPMDLRGAVIHPMGASDRTYGSTFPDCPESGLCDAVWHRSDLRGAAHDGRGTYISEGRTREHRHSMRKFEGTNLHRTSITQTQFWQCDFTDVDFSYANLTHTDFSQCTFTNTSFDHANLRHAQVRGEITNTSFDQTDLRHATVWSFGLHIRKAFDWQLSEAELWETYREYMKKFSRAIIDDTTTFDGPRDYLPRMSCTGWVSSLMNPP